ncbi:MAG: gamma-glutamyltransferase [Lysobacterales bacterium]|nr:MAG: gamma-glutamyltransferase [Xanthomonadales bacterium]
MIRSVSEAQKRGHASWLAVLVDVALLVGNSRVFAQDAAILSDRDILHPVYAQHGMVSTQDSTATMIGIDVLKKGGNAVDAAVAVGFALAVTLPKAGNIGGGGFMVVQSAESGKTLAIDYREMAPAGATGNMYLDADGKVDKQRARFSYLSVGVPGTVAGLALALEKYGTMSLAEVMRPAIFLARNGITVSAQMADALHQRQKRLSMHPQTARIFLHADGTALASGEKLVQSDLAWSLEQIARQGPDAFYRGEIANKIAANMAANNGLITMEDLKNYRAVERAPVRGSYHGYEVYSMPPPSSGGIHLIQLLNILEDYPIAFLGHNTANTIHVMVEAMKLAYADRSEYLGDPDFWKVPVAGLTSKAYAAKLREKIALSYATPSQNIKPGDPLPYESNETTHFSIMDSAGNVVSNTYTLNFSFGTGIVAAGTGILLNNEMDDFSAKPGEPNAYGLVGGEANAIEPGKRPLSSMSPTIVFRDGKPLFATGSPGGSRIITTTLQIIMNVIDHEMNIAAATAAPRIHHQWLPDKLRVEVGISDDTLDLLSAMGHTIETGDAMGSTQTVMHTERGFFGAADPRRVGALAQGY